MNPGPISQLLARGVGDGGIGHVLRIVRKHLRMDVAFISHFREVDRVFEHVDADGIAPIHVGQSLPLEDGYCYKVVKGELPQLIPDTSLVPAAMEIPATRAIPIGSHLSIPVQLENGDIYGTLCCFSHQPDRTLGDRDMSMMRAFGEVLASRIDEGLTESRLREKAADEIRSVMAAGAPRIVFQPIYGLKDDVMLGVECLSRFDVDPRRTPDVWFEAAHRAGVGLELELQAIRNALVALDRFPPPVYLGINTSPELILSGRLGPVLNEVDLSRIVIEITEHATVTDYGLLGRVLQPWRARGARLAIDDAGAGYASMRHILNLGADVIKLDMSLTRDIDTDPSRRALAKGLISFAHEVGSHITAEGVETRSELEMLRRVHVDKVQGYYLSKPLSLPDALAAVRRPSSSMRAVS
ncbi:MAG TPA: EAL domain-containing protein [Polyangiaceae bacterium]|nr:EAL domain-containing protein [Polyangiaceae bacterium]